MYNGKQVISKHAESHRVESAKSESLALTNFLREVASPRVERPALSARESHLRPPIFLRGDKSARSQAQNSASSSEAAEFLESKARPSVSRRN